MLLSKTRSRSKRQPDEYGKFLRNAAQCTCIICGAPGERAHLRLSSSKYEKLNGRSHRWLTVLCPTHHRLGPQSQHTMGEAKFWEMQGIDPLPIAQALWEARDSLEKMQMVCERGRNGTNTQ